MQTVAIDKKITEKLALANISKLTKQYKISQTGQGRKFYITKLSEAVTTLATVKFSETNNVMFLNVQDEEGNNYYVTPTSEADFQLIQSLPEEAIDKTIRVMVAPHVPDPSIDEASLERVEETYGKGATAKYRRAKENQEVFLALVSLDEYEEQ